MMKKIRAKVVLLGRSGAGKTSLVRRYISNEFSERHVETLGVRVEKRVEYTGTAEVELMLWDLAGEQNSADLDSNFLAGAHAVLFVIDQASADSFTEFSEFVKTTLEQLPTRVNRLLLNKSDLPAHADLSAELARLPDSAKLGEPWSVSAKEGTNVADLFAQLARQLSDTS